MILQESGENYLEMILMLKGKKGSVRSIDIANAFDFSKASVSRAMSLLKKNNLILMEANGDIHLTTEGEHRAKKVLERHTTLTKYLTKIGVDPLIAEKDACRIEHIISEETFMQIQKQIEQLEGNK